MVKAELSEDVEKEEGERDDSEKVRDIPRIRI